MRHAAAACAQHCNEQRGHLDATAPRLRGLTSLRGVHALTTHPQDDVEDDVENTTGRLIVTTKKIKALIRRSNNCKLTLCLLLTVAVLIGVLVLVIKLAPLAALG